MIKNKFGGKCAYTGKPLGDDWQVDHHVSVFHHRVGLAKGDKDNIDNLLPALKIVNHYKRAESLKEFRHKMITFHKRLAKVPKNPISSKGIKYKSYMLKVADAFDITPDKPFDGLFYFEKLNEKK